MRIGVYFVHPLDGLVRYGFVFCRCWIDFKVIYEFVGADKGFSLNKLLYKFILLLKTVLFIIFFGDGSDISEGYFSIKVVSKMLNQGI